MKEIYTSAKIKKNVFRRLRTWFKGLGRQIENKVGTKCGISTHSITDHSKTGAMGTHVDFVCPCSQ